MRFRFLDKELLFDLGRTGCESLVSGFVRLVLHKIKVNTKETPWGCQRWQSRVADFFCYFWVVFSERTSLTQSVVWKGAQQTLSIPPAAAEGLQVHFNIRASTMPTAEGSQKVSQNPWSEDASKNNLSQSKKTRRVLGGLTGGFVGRFCGGFLGLPGGFRGGRVPADFLFSAGGFSGGFFLLFSATKKMKSTAKIHRKIHHFHGGLLADFRP